VKARRLSQNLPWYDWNAIAGAGVRI